MSENKASLTQLPVNTVLPIHKKKKKKIKPSKTEQNNPKTNQKLQECSKNKWFLCCTSVFRERRTRTEPGVLFLFFLFFLFLAIVGLTFLIPQSN